MEKIPRHPAEWRARAADYWDKAQLANDVDLREQFARLAARYREMAKKIESRVAAASPTSSPKHR
jgi:hypothetical protein